MFDIPTEQGIAEVVVDADVVGGPQGPGAGAQGRQGEEAA
jgi:hypothetical protein